MASSPKVRQPMARKPIEMRMRRPCPKWFEKWSLKLRSRESNSTMMKSMQTWWAKRSPGVSRRSPGRVCRIFWRGVPWRRRNRLFILVLQRTEEACPIIRWRMTWTRCLVWKTWWVRRWRMEIGRPRWKCLQPPEVAKERMAEVVADSWWATKMTGLRMVPEENDDWLVTIVCAIMPVLLLVNNSFKHFNIYSSKDAYFNSYSCSGRSACLHFCGSFNRYDY